MSEDLKPCGECGMLCSPGEFHPYAACLMFRGCNHNGDIVRANLSALAGQQGEARPAREEVLRAALERLLRGIDTDGELCDHGAIDVAIAALATQAAPEAQAEPAGEPVAWTHRRDYDAIRSGRNGWVPAWAGKPASDDSVPLYDHAAASGERDTLRALLREARDELDAAATTLCNKSGAIDRIAAALADGGAK